MTTLNKEEASRQLQDFLRGTTMLVDGLDDYISKAQSTELRSKLQEMQRTYKNYQDRLRSEMRGLGSEPKEGVGFFGGIAEVVEDVKNLAITDDNALIDKVQRGLNFGVEMSNQYLGREHIGHDETYGLIKDIINENMRHDQELEHFKTR